MIRRLSDGRRVVVVLPGQRPPSAWRVVLELLAEAAVLVALFVAIPTCLYLLAWAAEAPR